MKVSLLFPLWQPPAARLKKVNVPSNPIRIQASLRLFASSFFLSKMYYTYKFFWRSKSRRGNQTLLLAGWWVGGRREETIVKPCPDQRKRKRTCQDFFLSLGFLLLYGFYREISRAPAATANNSNTESLSVCYCLILLVAQCGNWKMFSFFPSYVFFSSNSKETYRAIASRL